MNNFEKRVDATLQSIDRNVNKLLQWKAALDERCEAHRQQTNDVRKTLYGNPNGVIKKVNTLWDCKKYASKWKDFWMYVLKVVVAAGVIAVVGWLLLVYKVIEIGG